MKIKLNYTEMVMFIMVVYSITIATLSNLNLSDKFQFFNACGALLERLHTRLDSLACGLCIVIGI